jgi:signal transduction histidine kinase
MLSLHASIAIENASLYEQTQTLTTLQERERFAQDLHDGIIQSLYGVGLALDQTKLDIAALGEAATRQIDLSVNSLGEVIKDLRSYIFDLRPQALQQRGLKTRLDALIQELKVNIRLPVEAHISPDIDLYLEEMQSRHVFHICHEALSNAARHAKANHIFVNLSRDNDTVSLRIEDDGVGFEELPEIRLGHRGLANIQKRAAQLGGSLNINSQPQQGTRLTLLFSIHTGEIA